MVVSCSPSTSALPGENPPTGMHNKSEESCLEKSQHPSPPRFSGFVKFFNTQKGYGFIIPTDDLSSYYKIAPPESMPCLVDTSFLVFVHHSAIITEGVGFKSLTEHELVEFELVQGPKGIQAGNVTGPRGSHVLGDPIYSGGILGQVPISPGFFPPGTFNNPDGILLNGMLQGNNHHHHTLGPILYPTPPGFYPPGVISISPTILAQQFQKAHDTPSSIVDTQLERQQENQIGST